MPRETKEGYACNIDGRWVSKEEFDRLGEERRRTVCGCRVHIKEDFGRVLHLPAPDCPFCDGTGILKRTTPAAKEGRRVMTSDVVSKERFEKICDTFVPSPRKLPPHAQGRFARSWDQPREAPVGWSADEWLAGWDERDAEINAPPEPDEDWE